MRRSPPRTPACIAGNRIRSSLGSFARLFAVMIVGVLGGCYRPANEYDATVTGNVVVDGQLADRGTVTFHPVKGGPPAVGQILSDGSYSLRTGQGDLTKADGGTVPPGEYIVTVVVTGPPVEVPELPGTPPKGGPRLMAAKYASTETSDLKLKVQPGENLFVLELEPVEPVEESSDESPSHDSSETQDAGSEQASDAATTDAEDSSTASEEGHDPGTDAEAATSRAAESNGAIEPSVESATE